MRRRAQPVVVLGPHLRIFQPSFPHRRGSACSGLSCTRRHIGPAGETPRKGKRVPRTTRSHIVSRTPFVIARIVGRDLDRNKPFLPRFSATSHGPGSIREIGCIANNLYVSREGLSTFPSKSLRFKGTARASTLKSDADRPKIISSRVAIGDLFRSPVVPDKPPLGHFFLKAAVDIDTG